MFGVGIVELLITISGVILVGFTLKAARTSAAEAGKAAKEAKRQADVAVESLAQTRLATESELRAWVDVKADLSGFRSGADSNIHVTVKVRLTNVGRSPALSVATSQKVRAASSGVLNGGGLPAVEKYPTAMPSLMPGKDAEQVFVLGISVKDAKECIAECKGRVTGPTGLMVIVDVIAYYRTIFDKPDAELRMTSIRYNIHSRVFATPDQDISRDWIRSIPGAGSVKFAHDKSAPVYMT